MFQKIPNLAEARAALARSEALQGQIWADAVKSCQESGSQPATMLLLPALNEMFDITTTRKVAAQTHPSPIIFVMLMVLALTSALLAGNGMAGARTRSWIHLVGFALIMGMTMHVILDLEFPRLGFVRVDAVDQVLVDLRALMK